MPDNELTTELLRIQDRLSTAFNNVLCEMTPGYDDSVTGFNEAWDVARRILREEIDRARLTSLPDTSEGYYSWPVPPRTWA